MFCIAFVIEFNKNKYKKSAEKHLEQSIANLT